MPNTKICPECEALLINEEYEKHECNSNYKFEGKYLLIRDKGKWRTIYLPLLDLINRQLTERNTNPEDNRTICDK